jgi:hypothetical protein
MNWRSEAAGTWPEAVETRGFHDPPVTAATHYSFRSSQVTRVAKIVGVSLHVAGISLQERSPWAVLRVPHHTTRERHTGATPHTTRAPHGGTT